MYFPCRGGKLTVTFVFLLLLILFFYLTDNQNSAKFGLVKMAVVAGSGWLIGGRIQSKRAEKVLNKKHMLEQKTLYSQYYNDVYQLQEQNAQLADSCADLQKQIFKVESETEAEALQRDYDEFKQPDVDNDDRISRAEFNSYVKDYLSSYPGLAEKDYPRFEDFDHDKSGFVSFKEYSEQMALQVRQAEQEQKRAERTGSNAATQKSAAKTNALKSLYGNSKQTDSFDDLYANYLR